jgi:hypothetical protein
MRGLESPYGRMSASWELGWDGITARRLDDYSEGVHRECVFGFQICSVDSPTHSDS